MDPINGVMGTCINRCEDTEECMATLPANSLYMRGCATRFPHQNECVYANCLEHENCSTNEAKPYCGAPITFNCVECMENDHCPEGACNLSSL